nr:hypothetical protein [Tanacetum cinerariifolium]
MGDEHLDTIPATRSDEVIKSSVENLVPIPSESEDIPEHKCDVPFHDNSSPLDVSKDQIEDLSDSNEEFSLIDDDSFSINNIDYVEASPPDSELVNSELLTKSSSTSPKSFLEETNTFYNSLPKFKNFGFDLEEISSGSTTTHSDISLLDYEAFYFDDDHIKEISSGSTTTHSDISLSEYDSFTFDLSNDQCPPTDRSDFANEEFTDELAHIISPPEYNRFYFWNLPDPGSIEDKILVPKPPKNCARCAKCGHPVNGPYCQGCALLREKLEEDPVTYLKYFQDTPESSDDSTNVVNAPREPVVVKQDHGVNPPHIDKCCCECGNALDGIFCQQCICKSCGKGAHIGYNSPPKVPIISNPKPCNQTLNNELPQTLPSFDSVPCVSKPNFVDESSKIFNPPPQPPIYSCEFCESNAQYGHYCTPQAPFNNPELGYSQDLNFPQNVHNFQQQYLCCDQCGGPHETFQCQPTNEDYYHEQNSCYNSNSFGFDHCQPPKYTVNHPQEEKRIEEEQAASARYWKIPACCDDDDDYDYAMTPEETNNSLSMRDEHLDTIPATGSDEVTKSSVENIVLILTKDHFEIVTNSNDDISSSDEDSLYKENIEYVEASPHDSELVSLEAAEIEANTFHNSLPEFKNFYFDLEDISSGSTTTHSDISLPDYEAFSFDDGHIEEISGGSTTTHSDISLLEYDSFTFDLVNDQFPPTDRSDFAHEEFTDELAHIISPPEYDCFYFWNLPDPGKLMSVLNSRIHENLFSTTRVNLPVEDDHSPVLAYVVWIFLAYLTYPVIPPYLHLFGNEDTIFDPGITIYRFYSLKPGLSHR